MGFSFGIFVREFPRYYSWDRPWEIVPLYLLLFPSHFPLGFPSGYCLDIFLTELPQGFCTCSLGTCSLGTFFREFPHVFRVFRPLRFSLGISLGTSFRIWPGRPRKEFFSMEPPRGAPRGSPKGTPFGLEALGKDSVRQRLLEELPEAPQRNCLWPAKGYSLWPGSPKKSSVRQRLCRACPRVLPLA